MQSSGRLYDEHADRGFLARGLGRSYGDAALNGGGIVYDMVGDSGVSAFDQSQGLATVRAGSSLGGLLAPFLSRGWFPAVVPGTRHVTVGGAVAADIHGKNHHVAGGFCQHVVQLVLETAPGDHLIVRPGEDPDVFWATAGGMGLTGVIREVTFRLTPVETSWIAVDTVRAPDLDHLMDQMSDHDDRYRYSVAWLDLLTPRAVGRGVLTRGDHAKVHELPQTRRASPLTYRPARSFTLPDIFPSRTLNRPLAAAFNEAWFRRNPRREVGRPQSIDSFFFPLDAVDYWNRLYGRRGLVQYQFVVPVGQEEALRRVVARLVAERCPVFLAVLKRLGRQPGLLSFPLEGWTLAVDMPAEPRLSRLLHAFDEQIAGAGGRVYLAKDGRMRRDVFRAMYPELSRWLGIRERLDPAGALSSDLGRRLGLVG